MKVSIRVSILGMMLGILIALSLLILSINYFAANGFLADFAKNSLSHASGKISEQVSKYLQPLNHRVDIASALITKGIVAPESSSRFTEFLQSFVVNDLNVTAAYWGDKAGNFYFLSEGDDGAFYSENILHGAGGRVESIIRNYDKDFKVTKTENNKNPEFDPRVRS